MAVCCGTMARALLSAHAEVIPAVRDTAKGERVAQELSAATNNDQVHVLTVDPGSLASIRLAAEQFRARWSKLDLLINEESAATVLRTNGTVQASSLSPAKSGCLHGKTIMTEVGTPTMNAGLAPPVLAA